MGPFALDDYAWGHPNGGAYLRALDRAEQAMAALFDGRELERI